MMTPEINNPPKDQPMPHDTDDDPEVEAHIVRGRE
jgi:hypothetical protein